METKNCPPLKGKRLANKNLLKCNTRNGEWILSTPDIGIKCSSRSKYVNDDRYVCNPRSGRYILKSGYRRSPSSDAPRKPLTSFFSWMQEYRPIYKSEHTGLKETEIVKNLAQIWKSKQDPLGLKNKHIIKSKQLMEQYNRKSLSYKATKQPFWNLVPKSNKEPTVYQKWANQRRLELTANGLTGNQIREQLKKEFDLIKQKQKDNVTVQQEDDDDDEGYVTARQDNEDDR